MTISDLSSRPHTDTSILYLFGTEAMDLAKPKIIYSNLHRLDKNLFLTNFFRSIRVILILVLEMIEKEANYRFHKEPIFGEFFDLPTLTRFFPFAMIILAL